MIITTAADRQDGKLDSSSNYAINKTLLQLRTNLRNDLGAIMDIQW